MTTPSDRPKIANLADGHLDELLRSGLTADTIIKAGIYSAPAEVVKDLLGQDGAGAGMVFPYPTTAPNAPRYARVKLNRAGNDDRRYRSPRRRGNRLYIPATLNAAILADATEPLYITEGEKKCLKAVQEGVPCVALAGVWSWRQKVRPGDPSSANVPMPDLDLVTWSGRHVFIVFDSDLAANPDVQAAEMALASELARREASVSAIRLPGGPDGAKVGLDDYLCTHSVDEFFDLEPVTVAAAVGPISGAALAEILAADPVSLQTTYIVTPWIPDGICALSAKAGVGKGKLAQDLCLARVSGGTWLGLPVAPGPALFWSGEQGKREDFRVTQALARGRGLTDASAAPHFFEVVYDPTVRFGHPKMFAYVLQRLREHPGLFIVIDSHRRAFDGDESDSAAADEFYRAVLQPLKAAGATVLTLCHPPKTGGQQKTIPDENMIRGSGDWLAQLDSFTVLRPVGRTRKDPSTETITMRLSHPKPRSGPQADPLLVTLTITGDLSPWVTFTLTAKAAALVDDAVAIRAAVKAAVALFEEKKRLSRTQVRAALASADHGRPAVDDALAELVRLDVIRGPLDKRERRKGERGNWYVFLAPLPAEDAETAPDDPEDEPDAG